jgi:hypothetical protein
MPWIIAGLVVLVLAAGLIYSIHLGNSLRYWDEQEYFIYVKNFLGSHMFSFDGIQPTALRPPGYPFLLTIFKAAGAGWVVLRMLNFMALSGTAVILYLWLKEHLDAMAGVVGIVLMTGYPVLFYAAGTFFPQTFGGLLFLVTLYLVTKKPVRSWAAGLAGLLYGGLILTIPVFAFGIPLIAVWLCWRRRAWKPAVLFVIITSLIIGLWTVRNYRVFNAFVFVASDSGFNLLMGNAPETTPNSGISIDFNKYVSQTAGMNEVQADQYYRAKALQYILTDKGHALQLYLSKVLNYFNYRNDMLTQGESTSLSDLVMMIGYGMLILTIIIRIILFRILRFSDFELFLLTFYICSDFVYAVFFTRIRFRLPFDYLLIAVDALFLERVVKCVLARWRPSRSASL